MDKSRALQKLLNGTATKKEIVLLKQMLASGEISIGGDVKQSIVITGDGNTISLTPEALRLLNPEIADKAKIEEPIAGEPPYMGLRYFNTQDADLFYGRDVLTSELLVRVQKESFLAIVGASGSGKSSVARAGLIPAWKKENERSAIHVITPTAHPLESLAASLTREAESVTATSTLMDDLAKDARSLRLYIKKTLGETKLLLLVDQFEEIFTLCKDQAERKAFIENLLSLADEDSAARVVITLRADFYHHCAGYEGLRSVLKTHQEYIGAMTLDELRQAITMPAEKNGWDFQPGLVDLILSDVGAEPGALPLLSHALLETWKRRQGCTLTLQGYHDAGGVKKAIAQTAESVYDKLTPAEQIIAREIFLRLTELGEGTQDTRRRVKLDELAQTKEQDSMAKVLKTLTDARLVTTEQDSAEVAHEALIREWGTLRKWLDEDRESLRLHRHLAESAQEWERRGKEKSELYRGAKLKQLQDWVKGHGDTLSSLEKEFVKASQTVIKRERLRWVAIAYAGAALLCLIIVLPAGLINRILYRPVDMDDYWITIPAGEFQMGSENGSDNEKPVHTVYLDEYQIGRYEVTNRQYNNCYWAGVCIGNVYHANLDHPVSGVSWRQADIYCKWVGGRLPTEAEWEKAARGTDGRTYPWGEGIDCDKANYSSCVGDTSPVGSYENGKSPYGLYDTIGNVWEWVNDWYDENYYQNSPLSNPLGPDSNLYMVLRVVRGGGWVTSADEARSATRRGLSPINEVLGVGIRCARDVP